MPPHHRSLHKGLKLKWKRMAEEEERLGYETYFCAYGQPLATVTYFRYLGWILTMTNDNWPGFARNLRKARQI